MGSFTSPPRSLPISLNKYPKLTYTQAGHIRHIHNLATQPPNSYNLMGSQEPGQEFDNAYRYQLATMTYAVSVAHYHRLPALRGPFRSLVRSLIAKMLHREVWGYWFDTSHSGNLTDPDLKKLRDPWADPVVEENIMYSGHLLLMTSLYGMLFDENEFEKEGSLKFKWNPIFWGFGKQEFVYDNRKLQEVVLRQMEKNGWVGVCCEPNAIFVVCNQFPIIAMRYNDVRDGTNIVDGVLEKYKKALTDKGMIGADGLYARFYALKQGKAMPAIHGVHTAWANAFMNSWNSKFVKQQSLYEKQTLGYLTHFDGTTRLQPTGAANAFRKLVYEHGKLPDDPKTLELVQEMMGANKTPSPTPYESPSWGCFSMMLSELGKTSELKDILNYADEKLNPTWEKGGYFYARNDKVFDDNKNLIHMDPHSGNGGLAYARLNVEDGQKKMWENPWTKEELEQRPWIDGLTLADGVDFLRGTWDEEARALVVTLKGWEEAKQRNVRLVARNLPKGLWAVYIHGELKVVHALDKIGDLEVEESVGMEEVDIVILGQWSVGCVARI